MSKLWNFVRRKPAWMWMPTFKGPLRPLWPLYKRWAWWRERRDELPKSGEKG